MVVVKPAAVARVWSADCAAEGMVENCTVEALGRLVRVPALLTVTVVRVPALLWVVTETAAGSPAPASGFLPTKCG
jgi:hypothetical protein